MNAAVIIETAVVASDGTLRVRAALHDPTAEYTTKSVVPLLPQLKFVVVCDDVGRAVNGVFAIVEVTQSTRRNFDFTAVNLNGLDMTRVSVAETASAFVCSVSPNGVWDVPSSAYLNLKSQLTEWARTYNLETAAEELDEKIKDGGGGTGSGVSGNLVRYVYQVFKDAVVEENAVPYYPYTITLPQQPAVSEITVEANGIAYHEDEVDGVPDFKVDRANNKVYVNEAIYSVFSDEDFDLRVIYYYEVDPEYTEKDVVVAYVASADDGKRYQVSLKYKPTTVPVTVELNGISYGERDGGFFTVDREAKKVYLDGFLTLLDPEDLTSIETEVRVKYCYYASNSDD